MKILGAFVDARSVPGEVVVTQGVPDCDALFLPETSEHPEISIPTMATSNVVRTDTIDFFIIWGLSVREYSIPKRKA